MVVHYWKNRSVILLVLAGLLFVGSPMGAGADPVSQVDCEPLPADITFLQVWSAHEDWSEEKWSEYLKKLKAIGFDEIILQWTSYGGQKVLSDGTLGATGVPLDVLARGAKGAGVRIWLGLSYDPEFWSALARSPERVKPYLNRRLARGKRLMDRMTARVDAVDPSGEVFAGWYISDEIDDGRWRTKASDALLTSYLVSLRENLKRARPAWPVMISTFATGRMSPRDWARSTRSLLEATHIDRVLFQDGVGAGHLTLEQSESYLRELSKQLAASDDDFAVVVEIFRRTPSSQDGTFAAQSASPEQVEDQLRMASCYTRSPPVIFAAPEYLLGEGESSDRLRGYWLEREAREP